MSRELAILTALGLMLIVTGNTDAQVGKGSILIEEWFTADTGQQVDNDVTTLHNFINAGNPPSRSYWAQAMDRPDGGEDYWGGRMRGYLYPPQSGDYTFWTCSDDDSEVWLSTDENPANVKMICNVEGWLNYQDWTYGSGAPGTTYKSAPITLQAGKRYYVEVYFSDGTGGGFDTVAWGGPGIGAGPVVVDGTCLAPLIRTPEPLFKASNPSPANGTLEVQMPLFRWEAGYESFLHDVYIGTTPDLGPADLAGPRSPITMFYYIQGLEPETTYYWRVDEIAADGTVTTGDVWRFGPGAPIPVPEVVVVIDDFEDYTDDVGSRIFETWIDGYTNGLSGSRVGHLVAPYVERTIVLSGAQSMPMDYDNTKTPFFSETVREFSSPQNWTVDEATDLSLWVRGNPAVTSVAITEAAGGKITLTGDGTDIWNNSDQFTFAYKTLNGDGSMTARVVSIGPGTNTWAKAGVMIRDSLDGASTHAMMVMTANSDGSAGNGASFQWRPAADGASSNSDSTLVVKPPYWVKIDRLGDSLSGSYSADGTTWRSLGVPQVITMGAPVYIGLCVTSHQAGEQRTFEFDSITTMGAVTGAWQGAIITSPHHNSPESLYVVVEDSAGKVTVVTHPDPAVTTVTDWTQWRIPLSNFTGVNLSKVRKMYIGVGDRTTGPVGPQSAGPDLKGVTVSAAQTPGSVGTLYFDCFSLLGTSPRPWFKGCVRDCSSHNPIAFATVTFVRADGQVYPSTTPPNADGTYSVVVPKGYTYTVTAANGATYASNSFKMSISAGKPCGVTQLTGDTACVWWTAQTSKCGAIGLDIGLKKK